MNVLWLVKRTSKRNFKKGIIYAIMPLITLIISFIFFDMIDNPSLGGNDQVISNNINGEIILPISKILPFIVIILSWIMIFYASNYFLNSQIEPFTLLLLSGGNMIEVAKYVLYQITVIFIIVIPLSLILGTYILKKIYTIMFLYLNIDGIYTVPVKTYISLLISLIPILISIYIGVAGFSHRNTLQVLLGRIESNKNVKIKNKDKGWIFYIILYISSMAIILYQDHGPTAYVFPSAIGFVSIYGLLKRTIPKMIQNWKRKKGVEKEKLYISLSNYVISLQGTFIFSMLILMLACFLIPILISQDKLSKEFFIGIVSYLVITLLLVIAIVYKFIDHITMRKKEFVCLNLVGYIKSKIKIIMRYEVICYYLTIILLPLPLVLLIGSRYIMNQELTIINLIIFLLIYMIPIILSMCITYFVYLKTIITKEGKMQ